MRCTQWSFYPVQIWFQSSFLIKKRLIALSGSSYPSVSQSWSEKTHVISKNSTGRPNSEVREKRNRFHLFENRTHCQHCQLPSQNTISVYHISILFFGSCGTFTRKMEGGVLNALHLHDIKNKNFRRFYSKTNCNIHAEMLKQMVEFLISKKCSMPVRLPTAFTWHFQCSHMNPNVDVSTHKGFLIHKGLQEMWLCIKIKIKKEATGRGTQ